MNNIENNINILQHAVDNKTNLDIVTRVIE